MVWMNWEWNHPSGGMVYVFFPFVESISFSIAFVKLRWIHMTKNAHYRSVAPTLATRNNWAGSTGRLHPTVFMGQIRRDIHREVHVNLTFTTAAKLPPKNRFPMVCSPAEISNIGKLATHTTCLPSFSSEPTT